MSNKHFKRNWLVLLIVIGAFFLVVKFYWSYLLSAPDSNNKATQRFVVYQGESACGISDRLASDNLIRSSKSFCLLARQSLAGSPIQTGDFDLSPSMGASEILNQLVRGVVDQWVTLIEGWRIEEMAQKLSSEFPPEADLFQRSIGLWPKPLAGGDSEFIKIAKEGYMFPDTYLIGPKTSVLEISQKMRENFAKKYTSELQEKIKKQGLTPDEGVILASLVEREARSDEARKMVAGILFHRLKIGMALQTDATVQYALGYQPLENPPIGGWWKRHLTKEDLKTPSPYNTYLHPGLPPGPICNPSLSSLNAVAEAPDTPYLYYYHDSKGVSHYAVTLEEHNRNVATYP